MYRISQLAKRSGLSRSTLLYYETLGLICGNRSINGYRSYSDSDAQRLTLIQQLQSGGLTLQEIKSCLESKLDRAMLEQRLITLDSDIKQKQHARALLASLIGEDDQVLRHWHEGLETNAPDAHFQWLMQQGFNEKDALRLRWLSKSLHKHRDYMNDFERIYDGLDRLGSGSETDTLKALSSVPNKPTSILDIGSGTGASALVLAEHCNASIVALDNDEKSLETLDNRARQKGLDQNITIRCASMFNIPFPDHSFDLLWSEGSAYIMGFTKALKEWRRLLKTEGFLVISDLVWTTDSPDPDIQTFWSQEYPDMQLGSLRLKQAEDAGYQVIEHFKLNRSVWENYTLPLVDRLAQLAPSMPNSQAITVLRKELEILSRFEGQFTYQLMVLKNRI